MIHQVKKSILLLLLFNVSLFAKDFEEYQEIVKKYKEDEMIPGVVAILVGKSIPNGTILTEGNLSLKSPIPINEHTLFRIGPITQLVTAACLAYYVQEGRVDLNAPVSTYLPKSTIVPSFNGKEFTLGDLATHTSGLPDIPFSLSSRSNFSISQMYRFLEKYQLTHPVGERYQYSNFGYAFLSNILSRVTKRSFPELTHDLILEPLGMKDTVFTLTAEQKKRLATGYEKGRGVSPILSEKIYTVFIGSGGLYSSPKDLLTFLNFNLGKVRTSLNSLLPIMKTPYHRFKNFDTGLGWKIKHSPYLLELSGALFGFSVYIGIRAEENCGVILLTTLGDDDPFYVGKRLLEMLDPS